MYVFLFVCLFVCLFVAHLYTRGCRTGVKGFINFGHYSVPTQQCARWALETIGAETAATGKRNFPHPWPAFSNGIPARYSRIIVENPYCIFGKQSIKFKIKYQDNPCITGRSVDVVILVPRLRNCEKISVTILRSFGRGFLVIQLIH